MLVARRSDDVRHMFAPLATLATLQPSNNFIVMGNDATAELRVVGTALSEVTMASPLASTVITLSGAPDARSMFRSKLPLGCSGRTFRLGLTGTAGSPDFTLSHYQVVHSSAMVPVPGGSRNTMSRLRARATAILIAGLGVLAAPAAADAPHPHATGGWRLMRAANPHGGADAVSMSHTADIIRSDLELAGLMLRCGETGADVVIVVVSPFPPRAHPSVTISAQGRESHFEARVLPPGAELLLPAEAAGLAAGSWQSAHELAVKVSSQEQSFGE